MLISQYEDQGEGKVRVVILTTKVFKISVCNIKYVCTVWCLSQAQTKIILFPMPKASILTTASSLTSSSWMLEISR